MCIDQLYLENHPLAILSNYRLITDQFSISSKQVKSTRFNFKSQI